MKEGIDFRIIITGIVCLTILEIVALLNGVNGTLFTIIIAIIAGTLGITIPNPIKSR